MICVYPADCTGYICRCFSFADNEQITVSQKNFSAGVSKIDDFLHLRVLGGELLGCRFNQTMMSQIGLHRKIFCDRCQFGLIFTLESVGRLLCLKMRERFIRKYSALVSKMPDFGH